MDNFDRANEPLQVGFDFACDIIPRPDSITSVRIEDAVVITEDGCEYCLPDYLEQLVKLKLL